SRPRDPGSLGVSPSGTTTSRRTQALRRLHHVEQTPGWRPPRPRQGDLVLTPASSAGSNIGGGVAVVLMRFPAGVMAVPALPFAMALAGLLGVGHTVELPAGLRCRWTSCRLRGPKRLAAGAGLPGGEGAEAASSQLGWPWPGTWGSSGSDMGHS